MAFSPYSQEHQNALLSGRRDVGLLADAVRVIGRDWVAGEMLANPRLPEARVTRLCDEMLNRTLAKTVMGLYGESAPEILGARNIESEPQQEAVAIFVAITFRELYPNVYLRHASAGLMRLYRTATRELLVRGGDGAYAAFDRQLAADIEGIIELLVARVERQYYDVKDSVVGLLLKVIHYQDAYTQLHTLRVGLLAEQLAPLVYGGPPSEEFRLGVQMHDLGKVGVPQSIIQAPRPLSMRELGLMRQHPVIGADLLSRFETEGVMLDAAMFHHERWDGRGYPIGMAGERIPLAARIISVADTFDAMTSSRPYRSSTMNIEQALHEIAAGAGTQFDKEIAEAFVSLPFEGLEAAVHAELTPTWHTVLEGDHGKVPDNAQ